MTSTFPHSLKFQQRDENGQNMKTRVNIDRPLVNILFAHLKIEKKQGLKHITVQTGEATKAL